MKKKKRRIKKIYKILFWLIILVGICLFIYPKLKGVVIIEEKVLPVIIYEKNITVHKGEEINLLENVVAKDYSGKEVSVTINGVYNLNEVGVYNLEYVAKDNENNVTKEKFTLKVEEPIDNRKKTSKGFVIEDKNGVTYIDGYLVVNKTYSVPSDFGNGLTDESKDAFNKLKAAASLDGLNIYIASGYRSFSRQTTLYNNYVERDGKVAADTYSARPGHSEHQTGLAMDLNTVSDAFIGTPEAIWLNNNSYKYGFILRYPKDKSDETGFKYEAWHFRYVGEELAKKLYNNGDWITMEDYFGITSVYE